jgi:hypothetical protein
VFDHPVCFKKVWIQILIRHISNTGQYDYRPH